MTALESLSGPAAELLHGVGGAAEAAGTRAFLVGGALRDLILRRPLVDLDLMVENGLAPVLDRLETEWARWLALFPQPQSRTVFKKFFTAKLRFAVDLLPGMKVLDFSQARAEEYPQPGSPPVVSAGTLQQDLLRRDFSINAMAVDITPSGWGKLYDPGQGEAALADRELSILHPRSFEDDPVRLIRAVRFMIRFDFRLESQTLSAFNQAVADGRLKSVPRFRLWDELKKALHELRAADVVRSLSANGLLAVYSDRFSDHSVVEKLLESPLSGAAYPAWLLLFHRLFADEPEPHFLQILNEWKVPKEIARQLRELRQRPRAG
jgi:tRNA nucleotidyltransferase/poly(A) polymerase